MMQKQRSPYTGGGLNVQQLKATTFGRPGTPAARNGRSFLAQLAQQHMSSDSHKIGHPSAYERGQRSGTPRAYMGVNHSCSYSNNNNNNSSRPNCNYNGSYEGEMPTLNMGRNKYSPSMGIDDYSHMMPQGPTMTQGPMMSPDPSMPMNQQENLESEQPTNNGNYGGDSESETDYCQHDKAHFTPGSRFSRVFNYLMSGMAPQRQERMVAALQRCAENTFWNHVLLTLQLFSILAGDAIMKCVSLGINVSQVSLSLWRCKFQMRSIMRQMLWRMAGAKGDDAILFLGAMLLSPWLFLISLFGFTIVFILHVKHVLGEVTSYVRLNMMN